MARAADTFQGEREPGIQRGRGGFMRSANDTPYITDPTGARTKPKNKADEGHVKRSPYGSPSGAGKLIENTYNLQKWGERMTVTGIGVQLALIADCATLATLDRESNEWREAADRVVVAAKGAAKSMLAADRGTHAHALTEDNDEERDWIVRAEAGEILDVPTEAQRSLVQAWREMLVREGLEILAVEASCVDDHWRLAGTLDRIARTTKPLTFVLHGGEQRTIPAGTVLVLDVKSGRCRKRRDGTIQYWAGYAVQIAAYAQSVPYDLDTETRGEWPWEISQEHALIAHLDVLGAIDGNPSCTLVYVDITAGREHGGECVQVAKAWADRRDVFSVAQVAQVDPLADDAAGITTEIEPQSSPVLPATEAEEAPAAAPPVEPQSTEPEAATSPAADGSVELFECEPPDEGGPADAAAVEALTQRFLALPAEIRKGWWSDLTTQAQTGVRGRGRCPYRLGEGKTVRRFEIARALITLAEGGVLGGVDTPFADDVLRALVATVLDLDAIWWPTTLPGQCVGMLGATEAAAFARVVDGLFSGVTTLRFRDDGRPVAHTDLAAISAA